MFSYPAETRSRSTTPQSVDNQSQGPIRRVSVDHQSQGTIQRSASLDNQSEQPLQASGSDTNNPEESEDEGLGLSGFSETDNVKEMFKDMTGIVVEMFLENKEIYYSFLVTLASFCHQNNSQ